jgi:chaperonin GroES
MKKSKKAVRSAAKTKKTSAAPASKNQAGVIPLSDRVLVRPLSPEEAGATTSFGLIIPDSAKEKPEQGSVVAVGPGRRSERGERIAMEVKAGDRVYFKKPWDEPIKINGVEYYVIAESDITLVVTR